LARELSELGVVTLRADYPRTKDYPRNPNRRNRTVSQVSGPVAATWQEDLALRQEIAEWFRHRLGSRELWLAGMCYGARVAVHLAAEDPAITRLLLLHPFVMEPRWRRPRLWKRSPSMRVDPPAATDLKRAIERIPVTMMFFSERDMAAVRQALGTHADRLDLDTFPVSSTVRFSGLPEVQEEALRRTVSWASRALVERVAA
jgi:pimeloyl-ACP methyl ester carboxylesterase